MPKFIFKHSIRATLAGLALGALSTSLISWPPSAQAQGKDSESEVESEFKSSETPAPSEAEDSIEDSLSSEEAPPPEYPYPGAPQDGASQPAQPKRAAQPPAKPSKSSTVDTAPAAPPPPLQVERPIRTNEDGEYFYDVRQEKPTYSARPGVEAPKGVTKEGEFQYDVTPEKPKPPRQKALEQPVQMNAQGEYTYEPEVSPQSGAFSFRLGFFSPPTINANPGITFETIYDDADVPTLFGDYEWRLTSKVGRLGIKFGSGLFVASGQGKFKTESTPPRRADDVPEEKFTFIMFPNQLTGIYKFQYADTQWVVPYVEGGAGYFTFVEARDDNKSPKFGASPVTVAAGGVNILLDWLDRRAVRNLDIDYGINHVWLTGEYRAIVGLNKDFDFSSQVINFGFLMDF